MYSAFVLTEKSRNILLTHFPPKYEKVICHHITNKFGVNESYIIDYTLHYLEVYGYGNFSGLEALVVRVNVGFEYNEDGNLFHITHSLNPNLYKPKDSNILLKTYKWVTLDKPIEIEAIHQLCN